MPSKTSATMTEAVPPPFAPAASFPFPTTYATFPSIVRVPHQENIDGPEHKFQINEQLLYEHEFHGKCYVSAHLQRLQHGVFADSNIHGKTALHVTFVAITFVFHPSISLSHRFMAASIEITARGEDNEPLRFVKFAPHLAFGRISTETLKWNFQLSATLGVTKGPAALAITPTIGQEKGKILGTMMKIQGSTRSLQVSEHHNKRNHPDSKLVWSMEENEQQETGLPREFTFVFLVERPRKFQHGEKLQDNQHQHETNGHVEDHGGSKVEHAKCLSHDSVFKPMRIGINVTPHISNIVDLPSHEVKDFFNGHTIGDPHDALISCEVGQRLPVEHSHDASCVDTHTLMNGYYNFAKMPGQFEDLVELPGNAVTSVV
jgi:hypothetical protein